MALIRTPFSGWRPDVATFPAPNQAPFLVTARNVLPKVDGYGPVKSLVSSTDALAAEPRGGAAFLNKSGVSTVVAGTTAKLYELATDGSWTDVTRASGGDYTTAETERWRFYQYGDNIIGLNFTDAPQVMDMTSGVRFAAVSGSPPRARYGSAFEGEFVLANTSNSEAELWSSRPNDISQWDGDGTGGSWSTILSDGGPIRGLYEAGGALWVFQQTAIRRVIHTYDQFVVDIEVMERNRGVAYPSSVIAFGSTAFYIGEDGFYSFSPGAGSTPIGHGKVDAWFLGQANRQNVEDITPSIDPFNKVVSWAFASSNSVSGNPDYIITYHWALGEWSLIEQETYGLIETRSLGYSLEDLDTLFATLEDVTPSMDDPYWAGGALILGAFTTANKLGTFSGGNLAARIETGDAQWADDRRAFIREARVSIDAGTAGDVSVTVGGRRRLGDALVWGSAKATNGLGICWPRRHSRFPRFRVDVAEGANWTRVQGLDFEAVGAGAR